MSDHRKSMDLATAAMLQLLGKANELQVATMRGDEQAAEKARQEAHDVLDAMLDLKAQAMNEVRAILPR